MFLICPPSVVFCPFYVVTPIRHYLRFLGYQATGWNRRRDNRPA